MRNKRIAGRTQAEHPAAFEKAVIDGAKKGERYVDTCKRIEEQRIERPKGDL
jgi:hypothetical protein